MKEHETMKRTMMNRNSLVLSIVLATILVCTTASAQPYVLITMDEHAGEAQNILPPGEYLGNIHSNDAFTFGYLPLSIEGIVSSSSDHINYANGVEPGDVNMANELFYHTPPIELPEDASSMRRNASPWVSSRNGRFMTWIVGRGEGGIDIYQYPRGTPRADYLWTHLNPPLWQSIFVDGDCEVEGIFYGCLSIGCAGDMYILDNVLYPGSNRITGDFNEDGMNHILGLLSENDIFITNTIPNGRADGLNADRDNHSRHSIAVNGTLVALGGSVRIENGNDEDDIYQGPTPDERGTFHLKGGIISRSGIQLWNTNHQGTGYNVDFRPDRRHESFQWYAPYFTFPIPLYLYGDYYSNASVQIESGCRVIVYGDAIVNRLYMEHGSQLEFTGSDSLEIMDEIHIAGSIEEPARILYPEWEEGMPRAILTIGELMPDEHIVEYLVCDPGVELHFKALETHFTNSTIASPVNFRGEKVTVTGNQFTQPVYYDGWRDAEFSRNIFQSGLTIDGNPRQCVIDHCTITNPDGAGLFLDLFRAVNISNSIIANCVNGIVNDHWETPVIEYSDIYGNSEGDLIDCVLGEGCLSLDPLFVDAENGDYHLAFGSPCIDTGDPESPNDPDGTRADMGAFLFDHAQDVASETEIPSAFALFAPYPNPFNSTTTIGYSLPAAGNVSVAVYDLSGREVARLVDGEQLAGAHKCVWTADGVASGVYMVKLNAGGVVAKEKVVLVK